MEIYDEGAYFTVVHVLPSSFEPNGGAHSEPEDLMV